MTLLRGIKSWAISTQEVGFKVIEVLHSLEEDVVADQMKETKGQSLR